MKFILVVIVFLLVAFSSFQFLDSLDESIARGEEVYILYCQECHQTDGKGIEGVYPPLAQSDYLFNNIDQSIQILMIGSDGDIVVNGKTHVMDMDPTYLSDEYIADVMNYILNSWGNSHDEMITVSRVEKLR